MQGEKYGGGEGQKLNFGDARRLEDTTLGEERVVFA